MSKITQGMQRDMRNNRFEEVGDGRILLPQHKVFIGGVFTHSVNGGDEDDDDNIVVNQGLDHILGVAFNAASQVPTWYIGLFKGNYTPLAADTAANIASNSTEATEYDETTRVEWVEAAPSAQNVTNTANKAVFTANATVTIYGAFLISNSTKSGTAGILAAAARFAAQRDLVSTDQLSVTYAITAADA